MAKVIIFGTRDFAELAYYYLTNDSEHSVVGFTADKDYLPDTLKFQSLPVVPFEKLSSIFPPNQFKLFAPMAPVDMNKQRENVYLRGKNKGYEFVSYISSKATIWNNDIGENCFILEDNTLQPFTNVGNNVILWSGNHIGHHGEIKDHVFFTSHVVMSGNCVIGSNSFLGVNSAIRDNSYVSKGTLLGMGANLTIRRTEKWSVYIGSPAKKLKNKRSDQIM